MTINPSTRYQTILGWGGATPGFDMPAALRNEVIDVGVNEWGLTRLRYEGPGGNSNKMRRWEWINDNGDPMDINWSAFRTADMDKRIAEWVIPFKQRVEANGDPFNLYLSPSFFNNGSTGSAPGWLRYSPGEYAEYACALLTRLRDVHHITADYYSICNEAGNDNTFAAPVVGAAIRTLGPRMKALGLPTKIEFPECVNAKMSWDYIQALKDDADVWRYVGVVTYHLYGNNDARPMIRDFAKARDLPTGQTEFMGLNMNHLYDDLTLGGVSFWEIYGWAGPWGDKLKINLDFTSFVRGAQYWNFRQVMHYVRPGAVRVEVASGESNLRVLAFERKGRPTVILINRAGACNAAISGLSAGAYGTCRTVNNAAYQEAGLKTVAAGAPLAVAVPGNAVMTIYPYPGANQPPVATEWRANPTYLTQPASSARLSVSATDPEMDPLTYAWTLISQPAGADVKIAEPKAHGTQVTGLTAEGEYVFGIAISDGAHTTTKQIRVRVFSGNQPPVLSGVHNRKPLMVILPNQRTELRASGMDLEGDLMTWRWSVASQPSGANATLTSPTKAETLVTGLSVAGDYVFRVELKDPTHTVSDTLTVPVYPVNKKPVIANITAAPADIKPPVDATALSAQTSDPDGGVISHWWSVKSAPSGAHPVFEHPGAANTRVTGLTQPGSYTFTLTVVNLADFASRDVSVTVGPGAAGAK
ncbi:MAG: hypothetical protein NTX50_08455 [Candidatus Sumerlaeota bacterium]|nr:hypothetical protein [Candidatus Sumerlaeota bacterium]